MKAVKYLFIIGVVVILAGVGCKYVPFGSSEQDDSSDAMIEKLQDENEDLKKEIKDLKSQADITDSTMSEDEDDSDTDVDFDSNEDESMDDDQKSDQQKDESSDSEEQITTDSKLRDVRVDVDENHIVVLLVKDQESDITPQEEPYMKVGCDDLLVPVTIELDNGKTQSDLATAIVQLLTVKKDRFADQGLYNAVFAKGFVLANIKYQDGVREVYLEGDPTLGGVCDAPRIMKQIEETVGLYSDNYSILLNDSESQWRCLSDGSGMCE